MASYINHKLNSVNFFRSDICCGSHIAQIQGVSTLTILPEGLKEKTRVCLFQLLEATYIPLVCGHLWSLEACGMILDTLLQCCMGVSKLPLSASTQPGG